MYRYLLFFLVTVAACKAPHETDAYLAARLRKARRNPKVFHNAGGPYTVRPKLSKYNPDTGVVKMEYQSVESILEKGVKDQRNGRSFKHSDIPLGGRILLYVVERPAQVAIPKRWELFLTVNEKTKPLQTKKQYKKWAQNNPVVGSMVQFIYTIPVRSPLSSPVTILLKDRATKAAYSFKLSHGKETRAAAVKAVRTIRQVALTKEKPFMKSLTYVGPSAKVAPPYYVNGATFVALYQYDDIEANYRHTAAAADKLASDVQPPPLSKAGLFHRFVFVGNKGLLAKCSFHLPKMKAKRIKNLKSHVKSPLFDAKTVGIIRPLTGKFSIELSCAGQYYKFLVTPTLPHKKALTGIYSKVRKKLTALKKRTTLRAWKLEKGGITAESSLQNYFATHTRVFTRRDHLRHHIESLIRMNRYLSHLKGRKIGKMAYRRALKAQRHSYIRFSLALLGRMNRELHGGIRATGVALRKEKQFGSKMPERLKRIHARLEAMKGALQKIVEYRKELNAAAAALRAHKGSVGGRLGLVTITF